MNRIRMAAFAAVAGLAFVPGCCCFDGQLLNRMFYPPQQNGCCNECSTCSQSVPVITEGPVLGDPGGCTLQPGVTELGPQPRPMPQAQPIPATPNSMTKIK